MGMPLRSRESSRRAAAYVNLLRAKKKFGILQPAPASRLDIGIKLKGASSGGPVRSRG